MTGRLAEPTPMDLASLIKDNAAQLGHLAKTQLIVWLAVVRSPLDVVAKIDMRSTEAVVPALRFVAFVYAATMLVALPKMFLYQHVDVSNWMVVLSDFVLTAMSFCLVGLTLYGAGRLLRGAGGLLESMIAGLYLTALWPIVQATDYILLPELPGFDERVTMIVRGVLLLVVAVLIVALIVSKVSPVMAHVHGFGRVRATIAVLIQVLIMFV